MSYVQSETHFLRILNKALSRDTGVDTSQLLPAQFYLSHIYRKGRADAFTWDIHQQGASLLEEDNVMQWLSLHPSDVERLLSDKPFAQELTQSFIDLLSDLEESPGIYNFCRKDGKSLYVGKSLHLGQRMATSVQRFVDYDRTLYVKYIVTVSQSDVNMLEAYFIAKLKPPYNTDGIFSDDLNYGLRPAPVWSKKTQVFKVVRDGKKEVDHGRMAKSTDQLLG